MSRYFKKMSPISHATVKCALAFFPIFILSSAYYFAFYRLLYGAMTFRTMTLDTYAECNNAE